MKFSEKQIKEAKEAFKLIEDRQELERYFQSLNHTFKIPVEQEGKILSIKEGVFTVDYDGEIEEESLSDFFTEDLIEIYKAVNS